MKLIEKIETGIGSYVETYEEDEYRFVVTFDNSNTLVEAVSKYPYRPSVSVTDGDKASISFETGPFSEDLIDEYIGRLAKAKEIAIIIRREFFQGK